MRSHKAQWILVLGVAIAGLAASIGHSSDDRFESQLQARAQRIFEHDRKHRDLSANRLYALSIALRFGDLKGAEALVNHLEKQTGARRF